MAMLIKVFLACVAFALFSIAPHAQENATVLNGRVLAPDKPGRDAQIEAREATRAAEIRRAWIESGHALDARFIPPVLLSGKILTSSINVRTAPASPRTRIKFKTGQSGLSTISLYFYSATTSQAIYLYYSIPYQAAGPTDGTVNMQHPAGPSYGSSGAFNLYSAAGTWTLTNAYIYDQAGHSTFYSGAALDALFPDGRTISVVNNGSPDTGNPSVTAGEVLTPVIHKSTDPLTFSAKLTVSDDISGVAYCYVLITAPDSSVNIAYGNYPPSPVPSGKVIAYNYLGSNPKKGLWTIAAVGVSDVTGNSIYISGATNIMDLFGTTTFRVRD
jgi:hypothetical protein